MVDFESAVSMPKLSADSRSVDNWYWGSYVPDWAAVAQRLLVSLTETLERDAPGLAGRLSDGSVTDDDLEVVRAWILSEDDVGVDAPSWAVPSRFVSSWLNDVSQLWFLVMGPSWFADDDDQADVALQAFVPSAGCLVARTSNAPRAHPQASSDAYLEAHDGADDGTSRDDAFAAGACYAFMSVMHPLMPARESQLTRGLSVAHLDLVADVCNERRDLVQRFRCGTYFERYVNMRFSSPYVKTVFYICSDDPCPVRVGFVTLWQASTDVPPVLVGDARNRIRGELADGCARPVYVPLSEKEKEIARMVRNNPEIETGNRPPTVTRRPD